MGNPWLQHVKEFRAKHPGMSYTEALHHAKATYKVKGGNIEGGNIDGGGLVSKMKKANKVAAQGSKAYNNNKKAVDNLLGDKAKYLQKADKVVGSTNKVVGAVGGSLATKAKKARKMTTQANKVYDNNKKIITAIAGEKNIGKLDKARAVSGVMSGGRIKWKKAINTVSKIGAPIAMLSGHPEAGMALQGTAMATGGSFRAPQSRGGGISRASRVPEGKESGNLMKYSYLYSRPPPPGLRERQESIC